MQGLDDAPHRHRRQIFLEVSTPEQVGALAQITARWWKSCTRQWAGMHENVLFEQMQELLTRSACEWAGVPLLVMRRITPRLPAHEN